MSITVKRNRAIINEDELDIYTAAEVRDTLVVFIEKGKKKVILDMTNVDRVSASGLQVILSAFKTFSDFRLESVQPQVREELSRLGVSL